jgi:SAM-dependent methyltransferase
MDYEKFREKVSSFWAFTREDKLELGDENISWLENRYVSKFYVNKIISGDPEKNWLIYVSEKFFKEPAGIGLSVGCGDGCLERHGLRLNICKKFEAFDISAEAVDKAKQLIIKENLAASIHHIKNLEFFFKQANGALKQDGLLIINEYLGPSQFQWRKKQLALINKILGTLPVRFRKSLDKKDYSRIIDTVEIVPREIMNQTDPSEAIRSEEILSFFCRYFDVVEKIEWGGTILHPLFHKIIGNFDFTDEKDKAILDLVFLLEQTLICEGIIPSDFVLLIGKKKYLKHPLLIEMMWENIHKLISPVSIRYHPRETR